MNSAEVTVILVLLLSLILTNCNTFVAATTSLELGECKADCTSDVDCRKGLLCAAVHRKELLDKGYNPRRAYCPRTSDILTNTISRIAKRVCYDPRMIIPKNGTNTTKTRCPHRSPMINAPTQPQATPPVQAPIRSPVRAPISAPVVAPIAVPVVAPTAVPVVAPTQPPRCPDPTIEDAQSCDVFLLPSCFVGNPIRTCYRTKKAIVSDKIVCKDNEQCFWGSKQCRCNSKFGWMCISVQVGWVPSSTCSN
jgi:hypothetical protein